ncbi:hypothetical protein F4778DRAFT_788305 [Xylariomycetidae sp. FL2044]|nr:hypothetical protein F4778DRAFT_788305 [Xylariomycetidae sp. FL2044]
MDQPTIHAAAYKSYPQLTHEEFAEACHYLDARYCQAILGPLRKQWRLNVHSALAFHPLGGRGMNTTYLQVTQPLEYTAVDSDLARKMARVQLTEPGREKTPEPAGRMTTRSAARAATTPADNMMIEMEDSDEQVLHKQTSRPVFQGGRVTYEVHLHPTYRVPCLWFSLHNLPIDESPLDVETVFRHLVPAHFKDPLRGAGPIGGISVDHHPLTGIPTFFVHPCFLGEAMARFDSPKEDYLMVWLGLVGGCVGLWVPKELAMVCRE